MRLSSWLGRLGEQRSKTRSAGRRDGRESIWAPLGVRQLESRRVLNAALPNVLIPNVGTEGNTLTFQAGGVGEPELVFDWTVAQDGADIDSGTGQFFSFVPPDNGTFDVTVQLTDGDNTTASAAGTVDVSNVAPQILVLEATTATEEARVSLDGQILDAGSADSFTLAIDWNDPNSPGVEIISLAANQRDFTIHHDYVGGSSFDTFQVNLQVADDDDGANSLEVTIAPDSLAPSIVTLDTASMVPEDLFAELSLAIDDANAKEQSEQHAVQIDWGDDSVATFATFEPGQFSGTYAHKYLDDIPSVTPQDELTITAIVTNEDGLSAIQTTSILVKNLAPNNLMLQPVLPVVEGGTADLRLTFADPGPLDLHVLTIDWGDGTAPRQALNLGAKQLLVRHQYSNDDGGEPFQIEVMVTDDDGGSTSASTTVAVSDVPLSNLQIDPVPDILENGFVDLSLSFEDPGLSDMHTVTIDWGDGRQDEVALSVGDRNLTRAHQYQDDDPSGTSQDDYTISVTVRDDAGNELSDTTTVTVFNVAPSIIFNDPVQMINEGEQALLSFAFPDPGLLDTHTVVIDWGDGREGSVETFELNLGTNERTFAYTYVDDSGGGAFVIDITVTDDDLGEVMASTEVVVKDVAAELVELSATDILEHETTTLTGQIIDPGVFDTYTLMVNWGDPLSPNNVESFEVGVGEFSFEHQYLDDNPTATPFDNYTIEVSLGEGESEEAAGTTDIRVDNVAPELATVGDQSVVEGELLDLTGLDDAPLLGTFTDQGTLDTHTAEVDWGDDSPTELATIVMVDGVGMIAASHTYLDDGVYTVSVDLVDDDLLGATGELLVTVIDSTPTNLQIDPVPDILENGFVDLSLSFEDPGLSDMHTVTIDWGDGRQDEVALSVGDRNLTRAHQYQDDDPSGTSQDDYTISVTLRDDAGNELSDTTTVTVFNVAPSIIFNDPVQMINEGEQALLSFAFPDPGLLDTHTVVIDWGDGREGSVETFELNLGTNERTFAYTYVDDSGGGAFVIDITVTDDDLGEVMASTEVVVKDVAAELVELSATDILEHETTTLTGQIIDPGVFDTYTLMVNWGDPLSPNNVESFEVGVGEFSFEHQYLDDNPTATPFDNYTIEVSLGEGESEEAAGTTDIRVDNVAPELATVGDQSVVEGELLDLTGLDDAPLLGTFTDQGTLDTHTAEVDWGDDSPTELATIVMVDGVGTIAASHTYLDDGVYTVSVDLVDDDLLGATGELLVTVIDSTPTNLQIDPVPDILENGFVDLSLSFEDPGLSDMHTVTIDWGDGRQDEVALSVGDRNLTRAHQYQDDDPSGTSQDDYTISVTVRDDAGNELSDTTTVTVFNVAPSIIFNDPVQMINEGEQALLSFAFPDPGLLDTHTVVIDWGDGREGSVETFELNLGTNERTFAYTYVDDSGGGAFVIDITVTDDDLGEVMASTEVVVKDVAAELVELSATDILEHETTTLTGQIIDPGVFDTYTLMVNWGDPLSPNNVESFEVGVGEFSFEHQYLDDNPTATPFDNYTIEVSLGEGESEEAAGTTDIRVDNVAPANLLLPPEVVVDADGNAELTLSFDDVGTLDSHSVTVDWGDGSESFEMVTPAGARSATVSHLYDIPSLSSNELTVRVTVSDDDGGVVVDETLATITLRPGLSDLLASNVEESKPTVLTGTIVNPVNRELTLEIDWDGPGDLEPIEQFILEPGQTEFEFEHIYADDNPTNTLVDEVTIGITLIDSVGEDDGSIDGDGTTGDDESGIGAEEDPYADEHDLVGSDVEQSGSDEVPGDMPAQSATVQILVSNVNPELDPIEATELEQGSETTLTGQLFDAGTDTFMVMIDWGDGTGMEMLDIGASSGFAMAHDYIATDVLGRDDPTGDLVITAMVIDDDGGMSEQRVITIKAPDFAVFDPSRGSPLVLEQAGGGGREADPLPEVVFSGTQVGAVPITLQSADIRVAEGDLAATSELYFEIQLFWPDGSAGPKFRLPDEAINDLPALFSKLPDYDYVISLIRTENQSRRVVVSVTVRGGRPIDPTDDSDGTQDRPPAEQDQQPGQAIPVDQVPQLETVPGTFGSEELPIDAWPAEDVRDGEPSPGVGEAASSAGALEATIAAMTALAFAGRPWSQRIDHALVQSDRHDWSRLSAAARRRRRICRGVRAEAAPVQSIPSQ